MEADFWHERWRDGRIAFHQARVNPLLERHLVRLTADAEARAGARPLALVPLCGKSHDMWWLCEQGWRVLGVELSEIAVRDFFEEHGLAAAPVPAGAFTRYAADGIELLVGDVFALTAEDVAAVRAVYDRAALVALPSDLRARYVAHLEAILPPAGETLLITFEYPDGDVEGPPFSVDPVMVAGLHAGRRVELIESVDALAGERGLRARGARALTEHAFLISGPEASRRKSRVSPSPTNTEEGR